jgi:hypothetical protein
VDNLYVLPVVVSFAGHNSNFAVAKFGRNRPPRGFASAKHRSGPRIITKPPAGEVFV